MRPDQKEAIRPNPGRQKSLATVHDDDASYTDDSKQTVTFSQAQNNQITQPRLQPSRLQLPTESADSGQIFDPPLHHTFQAPYTGAPPIQPFTQKPKQTSIPALPATTSGPALLDPATSSPQGFDSHLHLNESTSRQQPETVSPPVSADHTANRSHLLDHDYTFSRPRQLTDHDYFMSVLAPEQPQQQSQGRPARSKKLPTRLQDYDLS